MPGFIEGFLDPEYGPVCEDPAFIVPERIHQPLCLSKAIGLEHGTVPFCRVFVYPLPHFGINFFLRIPSVHGKPEGRLGDECVASYGFKRTADPIVMSLVVSADHPNLPLIFNPYLCGTDDMSRRMKGYLHSISDHRLVPACRLIVLITQSYAHDRQALFMAEVGPVAGPGMVTVRMCDDRSLYRSPWIDMESSGDAKKTAFGEGEHGVGQGFCFCRKKVRLNFS